MLKRILMYFRRPKRGKSGFRSHADRTRFELPQTLSLEDLANLLEMYASLVDIVARIWSATRGPDPLKGWSDPRRGREAARERFLREQVYVPVGRLLNAAYDLGGFKSLPRVRRYLESWSTDKAIQARVRGVNGIPHRRGDEWCCGRMTINLVHFVHKRINRCGDGLPCQSLSAAPRIASIFRQLAKALPDQDEAS